MNHGNLFDNMISTASSLMNEITNLKGKSNYKEMATNTRDDILKFIKYIDCTCDQTLWDIKKCQECIDFEQYLYHNDSYLDNFTVLRNKKKIRKINCQYKPIIMLKVYQLR